jgi:hypothetical protein
VQQSAWEILLILAILMIAAWRVGLRMGQNLRGRDRGARWPKFDDASLALLGLLIAFTFGMSITRHDDRRLMVIRDSNAIGDFYTCATLLDEPVRSQLQTLIREYTEMRLQASRRTATQQNVEQEIKQSQQMQNQMTALVATPLVGREQGFEDKSEVPATLSFILMVPLAV